MRPFPGREALVSYAQGWLDVFDEDTIEPSEFIDLGDQVVAVGVVGCARSRPPRIRRAAASYGREQTLNQVP
ncbi:MAG TPA: hypothetical protein VE270_10620 [Thermoleophilaceae bacterium]|nr:hypothetical protein [Thermoleophilaceae bacterium]